MIRLSLGEMESEQWVKDWRVSPLGRGLITKLLLAFEQNNDIHSIAQVASLVFNTEVNILQRAL